MSNQADINNLIVSKLDELFLNAKVLSSLFKGQKSFINFFYERNEFLSKHVRLLQNALIVISSILVGVIFYLFSIS